MDIFSTLAWAQDPGGAPAAVPSAGPGGMVVSFLPFVLIFVVFYFLLILPQQRKQKKHKALLEALKKGDRVLTTGGLLGTVAALNKNVVTIQIADNVRVKIRREYIAELQEEPEEAS
ncbi:MAG TPA: preprotein translocase subunit YajC [Nitrospiria bacterium]|jgi:preprotein translocase subunit YajC|nr:preprotein translocase subunit YajC [Nitrospiria bacterium]